MQIIGFLATVLTITAFFPQTIKVLKTRRTRDVSLYTYAILIITSALWTAYGVGLNSMAIYITNSVIGVLCIVIVSVKLKEE